MAEKTQMCIECDDVPASLLCKECDDRLCGLCFQWLHRKGKRAKHTPLSPSGEILAQVNVEGTTEHFIENFQPAPNQQPQSNQKPKTQDDSELESCSPEKLLDQLSYIPLRLSEEERLLLTLMEGALDISEYTDKVDVSNSDYGYGFGFFSFYSNSPSVRNKESIIRRELDEMFSLISGLYTGHNLRKGQQLVSERNFVDNEEFFQRIFEIARRFKIMNPDKMRSTHGKMMHLLQDAVTPGFLQFKVKIPIRTVRVLMEECDCLEMINDHCEELFAATHVRLGLDPESAQRDLKRREKARKELEEIYVHRMKKLTLDQLTLLLNSITDCNSFIAANSQPVEAMILHLKQNFHSKSPTEEATNLSLKYGMGGSKLTHSHSQQFQFVLQSLMLWREIQQNIFKLWMMADSDLLSETNKYKLCNTGQGLNRLQAAPHVSRAMNEILRRVQSQLSGWVGLSVVHLGDRDVPNALVFIDKYNQVSRILHPIARTLQLLEELVNTNGDIRKLIDSQYEGLETCRLAILRDFFKHGFDGSGDDGGSCIDGRLTSCWNWCSKLEKKPFYYLFMLTGFEGFDGSYRK